MGKWTPARKQFSRPDTFHAIPGVKIATGNRIRRNHFIRGIIFAIGIAALGACNGGLGPTSVRMNRANFNESVQYTNKEQVLLNILRTYNEEPPLFLEVSQVTSSMSFSVNVAGTSSYPESANKTFGLNSTAAYSDSPTVTYVPLQGDNLAKSLMSPISVEAMVALYNSGMRLGELFDLTVDRLNPKVVNIIGTDGYGDYELVKAALQTLQQAGALQLGVVKAPQSIVADTQQGKVTTGGGADGLIISIDISGVDADKHPGVQEAFGTIIAKLVPAQHTEKAHATTAPAAADRQKFLGSKTTLNLLFHEPGTGDTGSASDSALIPCGSIRTRAPIGALRLIAQAMTVIDDNSQVTCENNYFVVHSSPFASPPMNAYATVFRNGRWYYISNEPREWGTRITFNCLSQILAIQSGSVQNPLLLTLPVNSR